MAHLRNTLCSTKRERARVCPVVFRRHPWAASFLQRSTEESATARSERRGLGAECTQSRGGDVQHSGLAAPRVKHCYRSRLAHPSSMGEGLATIDEIEV